MRLQAVEGGDDAVGELGADGVTPAAVLESYDADTADDVGAQVVRHCRGAVLSDCGCAVEATCPRQGHIGAGEGVPPCPQDGAQELEGLDSLVPVQGVGHLAPENLLEHVELGLDLADVGTGRETGLGDLMGGGDDRFGVAIVHASGNDLVEAFDVAAGAGRLRLLARVALFELGDRLVDDTVPGSGEDF